MLTIEEFRENYIDEEINASAVTDSRYPIEVFIDSALDILENDYSLVSGMQQCYFEFNKGNRAYKSMRIDAADLDLSANVLNLVYADYNPGDMRTITNDSIQSKVQLMLNFMENIFKGYFNNGELADPAVELAHNIKANIDSIGQIHLFIISTDILSNAVKKLPVKTFVFDSISIPVVVDVLDMEKIYKSRLAGFEKEDLVINCSDFGIEGIPCIKADIETDQYESYLAIVPGEFLADIYKKYGPALLESNVRSFLKFNGGVNKGIRDTILGEKSRFFTYNNGISTTAKAINPDNIAETGVITSFTNLQIINGGQTTATLAATSIKNNADLSGIYVQMKLTILKEEDPDLIRNIARFANSQNQVKTADLNSSHPFYVRVEDYSRKIYAPISAGDIVQKLWFFERARGQYEQPLMQMTKKQRDDYKLVRPRNMKYTLTDLAKYENASVMLPHFVSWGGQVNAAHFHTRMLKQWEKDDSVFDEYYYKQLIGKKILYEYIGTIVSAQDWYQEKRAYRPQLIAYTFSKLVYEAQKINLRIDYQKIWDYQTVSSDLDKDIALIAKLVFDTLYDEKRTVANIETYSKKEECWKVVQKKVYELSSNAEKALISDADIKIEKTKMKQKLSTDEVDEFYIFNKGDIFWRNILNANDLRIGENEKQALIAAIEYCNMLQMSLDQSTIGTIKSIMEVIE